MSLATDVTSELAEHQSARAAAEHHLLHCGRLPVGAREVLACLLAAEGAPPTVDAMARQFGCADRTVTLWLRRAKAIGLLSVTREGRRNCYQVNCEQLQRLAERAKR